jgi:hypothetical protein
MASAKKADEVDLGAALRDVRARLEESKRKIDAMVAKEPPPEALLEQPSSKAKVARLVITEIDSKLNEVRDARRARQMTPENGRQMKPEKTPAK